MTELDPGARELLDLASEGDEPTSLQRSRVRAAVLGRVGVAVAVTSATSAAASTSATGTAAAASAAGTAASTFAGSVVAAAVKVVAAAAIVGAMGTGGYLLVTSEPGPRPAATMAPIVAPLGDTPKPPATAARGIPSPVLQEAILPAPAPERPAKQQPSAAGAGAGAGPEAKPGDTVKPPSSAAPARAAATGATDTFAAETHALADAVAMLRDGHADRALDAFGAQDLQYAGGALGEERAAARIEALCVLGRTSEASAAAARFLEQHPRSLQAGRVRSSCGGSSGPSIP